MLRWHFINKVDLNKLKFESESISSILLRSYMDVLEALQTLNKLGYEKVGCLEHLNRLEFGSEKSK